MKIKLKFGWCLRKSGWFWRIERGYPSSPGRWITANVYDGGKMFAVYGWAHE